MKKVYKTYEEIDKSLEILKLERELHLQKLSVNVSETKDNLSISGIAKGFISGSEGKTKIFNIVAKYTLPLIIDLIKRKKS